MSLAGVAALVFTVALLVTTAYFIMGGLPLLILSHDTPLDQRFVRRFFEIYYQAAFVAAVGASASYALWGRAAFALGAAGVAALVLAVRRRILPAMARLSTRIQASEPQAIRTFRRVHGAALGVNAVQLVVLMWGLTQVRL